VSQQWREIEMNARTPTVFANRVAIYSAPNEVGIRFLHLGGIRHARSHEEADIMEITNVCHVVLAPSVAKRLIVDLQNALATIEERMGAVTSEEDLGALWTTDTPDGATTQ